MSNNEINPKQQYVLSYNDKDFYSISLYNGNASSYCSKRENSAYSHKKCNNAHNYYDEKNKSFIDECNLTDSLCENVELYNEIKKIQTSHSGSDSRFSDINDIQKNEILKTINLGIGIMVIVNVIYNYI